MDPRVYQVIQMLCKQAVTAPPCNSNAAIGASGDKEEQKMSLEEMAFEVDLSESRMRAIFKSHFGLPPIRYVIKMKMDKAAKELKSTCKRVTEIAVSSGFDSDSYFARAFKKAYGMTPTQYRKLHQQPSEDKEKESFRSQ